MAIRRTPLRVTLGQLWRFGLSGAAINVALYLVYLALTALGLSPIAAASAVFLGGIPISLFVHGRVSFRSRPATRAATLVFWGAYLLGYGVQIGVLSLLHHGLNLPHPLAQLMAMGLVAITLFVVQKWLVFRV